MLCFLSFPNFSSSMHKGSKRPFRYDRCLLKAFKPAFANVWSFSMYFCMSLMRQRSALGAASGKTQVTHHFTMWQCTTSNTTNYLALNQQFFQRKRKLSAKSSNNRREQTYGARPKSSEKSAVDLFCFSFVSQKKIKLFWIKLWLFVTDFSKLN